MSTVLDRPMAMAAASSLPGADDILTDGALGFIAEMHHRFDARRRELLAARIERQKKFDAGELPDFPAETHAIREADWTVGPIPADLQDRRQRVLQQVAESALLPVAQFREADARDGGGPQDGTPATRRA